MPYQYEVQIKGFDQMFAHFEKIGLAMFAELHVFLMHIAEDQTGAIVREFDQTVTSRSGKTRGAIRSFVREQSAGTEQNPIMDTIKWLNEGTGIYGPRHEPIFIHATKAKALHFEWQGKEYFRKSVIVKGIRPRRFIEKGIAAFRGGLLEKRIAELEQRLAQLAREVEWK